MAAAAGEFSLANQSLKLEQASDIEKHVAPLRAQSDRTTSIALNGNTIGVPAAEALAAILATQTSLASINLADIFTGRLLSEIPQALEALLQALLKCPKLHTVDLSDNAFGLNTVAPLVGFLRHHTPLQHLILNNNGLGPTAGAAVAEALHELATRKQEARAAGHTVPELETIVCGRNRLETGSMAAWARAYGALPGIQSVKMVQNGIRQEGIIQLLRDGLSQCRALRVLDLQDNTFTNTGSMALAKALPAWPQLRELGVGDCLLGARGFVLVANALGQARNPHLHTIRAQYDEVNAKGLAALVKAAGADQALPALQRVELNGNKFVEDDAALLQLQELLRERRTAAGADADADDEHWGLDELSDLEDESDEEDEDDEDEEDEEEEEEEEEDNKKAPSAQDLHAVDSAAAARVLEAADQQESESVAQKKDAAVDALAEALDKTL